jgi:hypothetical protein
LRAAERIAAQTEPSPMQPPDFSFLMGFLVRHPMVASQGG